MILNVEENQNYLQVFWDVRQEFALQGNMIRILLSKYLLKVKICRLVPRRKKFYRHFEEREIEYREKL